MPVSSVRYLQDARRPDLIPGADGTIRWAYRRMQGWRASRARVVTAVRLHAPQIPVIGSPNWPPELSPVEALSAAKARRRP